jgi:hypothetical protein
MLDGVPHWLPPAWQDPDQTPRRNTRHHIPVVFTAASRDTSVVPV